MNEHSDRDGNGIGDWIFSRTGVATVVAISILAFLVYSGHSAHLLGALPFLLILSCPLMHMFMHGGHGGHDSHGGEKERQVDNKDQDPKSTSAGSAHHHH